MNPSQDDPILTEIERGLAHDDPRLAERIEELSRRLESAAPRPHRRLRLVAGLCIVIVAVILIVTILANAAEHRPPPPSPPTSPPAGVSVPVIPGPAGAP